MTLHKLAGGNDSGAIRDGEKVHRAAGPWTASVHGLLNHLEQRGFTAAPRPLGFDAEGRELLTFLEGEAVGDQKPWPAWVHTDDALIQVAAWLRSYHQAVADFVPEEDAQWRQGRHWEPGLIIGHNDAAPYNATWQDGQLSGFFDWDLAGPVSRTEDLAFTAFAWVPLQSRAVVEKEGFTDFAARPRRLQLFLDEYGWTGTAGEIIDIAAAYASETARLIRELAAGGEALYEEMLTNGMADHLESAAAEMQQLK